MQRPNEQQQRLSSWAINYNTSNNNIIAATGAPLREKKKTSATILVATNNKNIKSQPPELPAHASLKPRVPAESFIASKQVPLREAIV